ncbi:unnamed protein product [Symbiodinium natans]|uniref:Uncharacterized protein n=1 Tax=Symbiodinium natans TaxID=878477 RepID=A0A812RS80_9DINO|nr:unnamed protein product [Symbiodinium natans]
MWRSAGSLTLNDRSEDREEAHAPEDPQDPFGLGAMYDELERELGTSKDDDSVLIPDMYGHLVEFHREELGEKRFQVEKQKEAGRIAKAKAKQAAARQRQGGAGPDLEKALLQASPAEPPQLPEASESYLQVLFGCDIFRDLPCCCGARLRDTGGK